MQIPLVHTLEGPQIRPEGGSCPLAGVAMDLADAIPIGIPRPLVYAVADGGVRRMAPTIALPLVGIESCAAGRHVVGNEGVAGPRVRVVTHPKAALARVPRDDADDGGPIVGVGSVPFALVGPPPGRVRRIRMGRAFFPPRSGTVRRPQTSCQSSPRLVRCCSGSSARAGATCAVACGTHPTRGLSARWVRLSPCRVAGGPAWLGVGGSFQIRCWSRVYSSRHTRGNGRQGSGPAAGRVGARDYDSEGMQTHPDAGDAPAR
jgi:hypothetical protein